MARQKKITKSKIKKIVPEISKIMAEFSSDENEIAVVMSRIESVLDEAVASLPKEDTNEDEDLAGGLSGVVNPKNLGSTGAPRTSEGYHIMQKSMSSKQDAIKNRGT